MPKAAEADALSLVAYTSAVACVHTTIHGAESSTHRAEQCVCITQAITLAECDIYTYKSDLETDPFGELSQCNRGFLITVFCTAATDPACLEPSPLRAVTNSPLLLCCLELSPMSGEEASVWSFNYFFFNKKMKRILYLSCRAKSRASADPEVCVTMMPILWSFRVPFIVQAYESLISVISLWPLTASLSTTPGQESETVSKQYYSDSDEADTDAKYGMANEMDV